jgi:hypothetical protein
MVSIRKQVYTLRGKRRKDRSKTLTRDRVPCLRQQFQKGLQGKTPLLQPGMGYFQQRRLSPAQGRQIHHPVAKKENINVQGPLPPALFVRAIPAMGLLDTVKGLQKGRRFTITETREGGIDEGRLIGHMKGIGPVKGCPSGVPQQFSQ